MMHLLVFALVVGCVTAYPSGAANNASNPMDAFSSYCTSGNFRPNHGNLMPQSSSPPYRINVTSPSGNIYRPGQIVTIVIEGESVTTPRPATQTFKGFFLQGDATESSFAGDITCGNQGKKVTFCNKAGVTHTNAVPKQTVECKWTPPDFQIGTVQFVASIVADFATFWTGVQSSTTLTADPKTMTYEQKALQLRQQMMSQFQSGGLAASFGQQSGGNPFSALMGGGGGGGQNPFAGFGQQRQQQSALSQQFGSMFGGGQ